MRWMMGMLVVLSVMPAQAAWAQQEVATIWLVRHAEAQSAAEAGDGHDPVLTAAGRARADGWHAALGAPSLVAVYATRTARAEETAQAIAEDAGGVELRHYDYRALPAFAEALRAAGESVVVVGHSNTTPELARLLGVDAGDPIGHHEHGRVYEVRVPRGARE